MFKMQQKCNSGSGECFKGKKKTTLSIGFWFRLNLVQLPVKKQNISAPAGVKGDRVLMLTVLGEMVGVNPGLHISSGKEEATGAA